MSTELFLLKDVANLGQEGDIVKVSPGYARNYLIPQGIAEPVTEAARRRLAKIQAEREKIRRETLAEAKKLGAKLKDGPPSRSAPRRAKPKASTAPSTPRRFSPRSKSRASPRSRSPCSSSKLPSRRSEPLRTCPSKCTPRHREPSRSGSSAELAPRGNRRHQAVPLAPRARNGFSVFHASASPRRHTICDGRIKPPRRIPWVSGALHPPCRQMRVREPRRSQHFLHPPCRQMRVRSLAIPALRAPPCSRPR